MVPITHWTAIPPLISPTPFVIGKYDTLGLHSPFPFGMIQLRVSPMLSKWAPTEGHPESLKVHIMNVTCLGWS